MKLVQEGRQVKLRLGSRRQQGAMAPRAGAVRDAPRHARPQAEADMGVAT